MRWERDWESLDSCGILLLVLGVGGNKCGGYGREGMYQ